MTKITRIALVTLSVRVELPEDMDAEIITEGLAENMLQSAVSVVRDAVQLGVKVNHSNHSTHVFMEA